tara:strand:+ start:2663 stop:3451 length:789 start_codon:yes stop_codon:yes gene_type:complete
MKFKIIRESVEDFDWVKYVDAKLPTLGELFDDGRLELDDIITLRGEVVNGKNWKKKWFNEFVIELVSKGESLTSGTFFNLIDDQTYTVYDVFDAMGLSSGYEITFLDDDKKLEVLSITRNGEIIDNKNINESSDFDWTKDIDVIPIKNSGSSCDATYDLVFDYFISKQPIIYGDYYYSLDSRSGTIVWGFNDTDEYAVYATPYWEGNCFLPISIQGGMGDYEELLYMELPQFNYREELFNWLENVYPNIVASAISDLGPLHE